MQSIMKSKQSQEEMNVKNKQTDAGKCVVGSVMRNAKSFKNQT